MISANNVTLRIGKKALFEDVNIKFTEGNCYGLIGANGAGKSTLLKCINGLLKASDGTVKWLGQDTKPLSLREKAKIFGYVPQNTQAGLSLTVMETVISGRLPFSGGKTGKEDVEKSAQVLEQFGLSDYAFRQMGQLSGGERQRILIARALAGEPQVLLLDEPTNYLDVEHIEWLTKFLQNYENAFILISHDISFLNKVVNVIYHLENCELTRYTGNYDKFQEMYAIYKAQKEAAYERQQQEVAKLEDFIARNKARVATTNMAKSRQKKLDKMEMIEKPREKPKAHFQFKEARTPSRYLAVAEDLVLGYDTPLTRPVSFKIECGQKIAIRGVNGLGKTTLLKTILGIIPPISGKIELGQFLEPGYFEQEEREKNENTALEDVWNEYPGMTNYEVRAALAAREAKKAAE